MSTLFYSNSFDGIMMTLKRAMAKCFENPAELNSSNIGKCPLFEHNNKIIANIHIDDLNYLEKDLEFNDKVSLIFLLYGGTPLKAKYGLQTLLIAYQSPTTHSTFIQKWVLSEIQSQPDLNWQMVLIEALWTIKAIYVLQKLGLDADDLHVRFLNPENAEINLFIHPILKGVFCCVCEKLHPDDAKQLINFVSKNYCKLDVNFTDEKYLEVFLLHWLSESVIEAGDWNLSSKKRNVFCDMEKILDYLKLYRPDLGEELQKIIIRFDFTTNNVTSIERKKNVTDDGIENEKDKLTKQNTRRMSNPNSNPIRDGSDDKYVLERDTAGLVLIINQIKFYRDPVRQANLPNKQLEKRHGSDKDAKALKRTFSSFGYRIIERENLTDFEIKQEVDDVVKKSAKSDSLIVCILSHGSNGVIYGENSLPVKIKEIEDRIVSKELLNKPKILILQSCQGEETQIAETLDSNKLAYDGPNGTIPMRSDFCVAKSTIPGFSSIRHIENGSWFIQNLCSVINEYSDKKHFIDIMTIVIRRVTELRGDKNECMVPKYDSTFTKEFYFPPRITKV